MALIKHRPRIQLLLPAVLRPGQGVKATVVLDVRHEVAIESLDVRVDGKEWGYAMTGMVGTVPLSQTSTKSLLSLSSRLSGPRTLSPGKLQLPFRFSLPGGLPPSYRGRSSGTLYEVHVHAAISWWPDARASFVARVEPLPGPAKPPRPLVTSTAVAGPRGNEPFFEISLADRSVAAGSDLVGAVALGNVEQSRYCGLGVSLVGTERVTIGRTQHSLGVARYTLELPVRDAVEGAPIPFRMRIPDVTPTTQAELWRLGWSLEVRARRLLARDLVASVPVTVLPSELTGGRVPRRHAAPSVGSERMRALWSSVAERIGWQLDGDELVHASSGASLRLWREHRGRRGLYLVAEMRFQSLGLGLDGGAKRGFRRFLTAAPVVGGATFDEHHYLVGREPGQVQAFAGSLGLWQVELGAARFADIDDEHLVVELKNAGLSRGPLEALAGVISTLARALPAARAAIPPPASMRDQVDDWAELARELDGALERARMIASGRFGVHPARVATEWGADGTPLQTQIELRPANGLPGAQGEAWLEQPLERGRLPRELPSGVRRLLGTLGDDVLAASISAEGVTLSRPAPLPEPLSALDGLALLSRLVEELASGHGPYR